MTGEEKGRSLLVEKSHLDRRYQALIVQYCLHLPYVLFHSLFREIYEMRKERRKKEDGQDALERGKNEEG